MRTVRADTKVWLRSKVRSADCLSYIWQYLELDEVETAVKMTLKTGAAYYRKHVGRINSDAFRKLRARKGIRQGLRHVVFDGDHKGGALV